MIALTLPCLPPRKNVVRRARLSKTGKIYMVGAGEVDAFMVVVRAAVSMAQAAQPIASQIMAFDRKSKIEIEVWFTFPSHRFDADGPYYVLQDCLAKALGFNDLQVIDILIHKRVKRGVKETYVQICEVATTAGQQAR